MCVARDSLAGEVAGSAVASAVRAALDACVAAGAPGALVAIDARSPRLGFSAASGVFERGGRPLRPEDSFRAASVSKAVTAATAVRLAAQGRWSLDDPVTSYLPPEVVDALRGLEGLASVDALTLRRLLGHTSGLPDYFFDPRFQARVRETPDRTWRPTELVRAVADVGRVDFAPGTDFAYGDTGYVVAGLAIEGLTGETLADACRSLVLDPLGMDATWLEWHEPPRGAPVSHHYDGERDLLPANTSFDWAGGGLVTTAADLVAFLRGLFHGALFEARWLAEMTRWREGLHWRRDSSARYLRYGLGIGQNVVVDEEVVGATGVWGAFAYYWPAGDAALAGTVNLRGADRAALLGAVLGALRDLG